MARKNIKAQEGKNNKKIVQSKKESKIEKIKSKQNKKQESQESGQIDDQQQIHDEQASDKQKQGGSEQNDEESSGSGQDQQSDDNQDSEQQSSEPSLAPENYAIKQMQFRQRRGTKMNYLMSRKKQQEEDSFWQKQGQDYFGNLEDQQNDEDYQQSSSGRDQFDSDFDQTQSEHQEEQKKVEQPQVDEQKQREKKKQQQLMRKIGAPAPKKLAVKTNTSAKKNQSQKKPVPQVINRYIHQVCTQQQLLGQAAQTQYINWLSLQKLISLENEKKDFTHRQHFLDGEKIIFRDKIDQNGKRSTTYQLFGVSVNKISDLTQFLNKEDS